MVKNEIRAARTKAALIAAARVHFARGGYAQTRTEAILEAAGVARGALYHHYRDKAELFEAVCAQLAAEAADAIRAATEGIADPVEALAKGSRAWIDFMARPESRRILVLDAPGVLGWERWNALDRDHSFGLLAAGVRAAITSGAMRFAAGEVALSTLLNGAMNQAALEIGGGAEAGPLKAGLTELILAMSRE